MTPVPYALGSAAGSIRFTRGRDTTNRVARDDERDAQELPVRTLDEVLDGRSPVLIKLDVEGHEREVLEGATATLDKPSLVAIESESENDHVVGRLAQAGFSRWYYDPFERALSERSSGSAKSSNALFLRNVAVCLDRVREAPRHEILGRLL